jgi:hypothetical protein
MFSIWWKTCGLRYLELDECNQDTPNWVSGSIFQNIYHYIKNQRIANKDLHDKISTTYHKSYTIEWNVTENPKLYTMDSVHHFYYDMDFSFNQEEKSFRIARYVMQTTKPEGEDILLKIVDIERQLQLWDREVAKLIIDLQDSMWV